MGSGPAKGNTVSESQAHDLAEQVADHVIKELSIQNAALAASEPDLEIQSVDYEECRKRLEETYMELLRARGMVNEEN